MTLLSWPMQCALLILPRVVRPSKILLRVYCVKCVSCITVMVSRQFHFAPRHVQTPCVCQQFFLIVARTHFNHVLVIQLSGVFIQLITVLQYNILLCITCWCWHCTKTALQHLRVALRECTRADRRSTAVIKVAYLHCPCTQQF